MKSEHRHELKTNELAEWIGNLPQWTQKNLNKIITVSVIVILVAGYAFWHNYEKNVLSVRKQTDLTAILSQLPMNEIQVLRAQATGQDYSFALLEIANRLKDNSNSTKNDQLEALALIKHAKAVRMELLYRIGLIDKQKFTDQINLAKDSYDQALSKASSNPSLIAAARLGLGLCAEELGNFTEARQIYTDITSDASLEGTAPVAAAKLRLNTMADYQKVVLFRKSIKKEATTVRPQISIDAPMLSPAPTTEKTDTNIPSR